MSKYITVLNDNTGTRKEELGFVNWAILVRLFSSLRCSVFLPKFVVKSANLFQRPLLWTTCNSGSLAYIFRLSRQAVSSHFSRLGLNLQCLFNMPQRGPQMCLDPFLDSDREWSNFAVARNLITVAILVVVPWSQQEGTSFYPVQRQQQRATEVFLRL